MIRPVSFFLLALFMVVQGCSLDFLSKEDTPSSNSGYTEYDSTKDIKYAYDGDDNLIWIEYYDFNSQNQCVFLKHTLPSGTLLWSYVYNWSGSNLVSETYFGSTNSPAWFNIYSYSGSNPVKMVNYDENNTIQWFQSWSYTATSKIQQTARFNSSSSLEWAYTYTYDGADNLSKSSCYGANSIKKAYIDRDYDGSSRIIKKTGYGSTTSKDSFESPCSLPSFPSYGGVNTTSRNTAGLTAPASPASPSIPSLTLTDSAQSYTWMTLWLYDSFGYSGATLNSSYMPVYLIREAPDYLNDKPLEAELTYESSKVKRKTVSYNGQTLLQLDFGYNSNSYLTSLDTSGASLYIPLRYEFAYIDQGGFVIPGSIRIYNNSTLLQSFIYAYSGTPSSAEEYAASISSISHYDGDNTYIGRYVFSNSGSLLTIGVEDKLGNSNGKFELLYNGSGQTLSFTSYDKTMSKVWDYQFSYDIYGNRVAEALQDKNSHPQVADFFSVESLFADLRLFLP